MKKLTALILVLMFAGIVSAQKPTYKIDKSGKITTDTTKTVKKSTVYQVVNGVTFYKGIRGGIYWIDSKGKKQYVKKSK